MDNNILYMKLGEAVVAFERLVHELKVRLSFYYGFSNEASILLDPYTANQTIERFSEIIDFANRKGVIDRDDLPLYKALVSDLRALNTLRNKAIHSSWYTAHRNGKPEEVIGFRHISPLKDNHMEITVELFDEIISKAQLLHSIIWTVGSLEGIRVKEVDYKLSISWERDIQGKWMYKLKPQVAPA